MAGEDMLSFIPLHSSAIDRSPTILDWVRLWTGSELEVLTPADWFQKGHDIRGWKKAKDEPFSRPVIKAGTCGWFLPPAAADVALEQLRIARIKQQDSTHVFVCPQLFLPVRRKQLGKACDLMFSVPVGATGWPVEMCEPLLTGVCFPFLSFKPWQFGGTPKLSQVARQMHGMRDDVEVDRGLVLCKFWGVAHRLLTMPECMVSRVPFFERQDPVSRGDDRLDGKEGRKQRRPIEGELGKKGSKRQRQMSQGPKRR
jgi:hypothetical protein